LRMFCQSLPRWKNKKRAFHQHFRPFRCIKHCKLQYFVFIFFQKPPPHGGPLFGGEMSLHRLFGRDFSSFFCNQCLFTISLVESFEMSGRKNSWKILRGEISLQMPFSERLVFKIVLVGICLQMFFGRGFFEFVWKKFLCTVCFVERFFSRLVWWIFFLRYIWVELYFQIFFGSGFHLKIVL